VHVGLQPMEPGWDKSFSAEALSGLDHWTQESMQAIVSAAKARTIALEINDISHTPDERFIRMAREQGLKFTFDSDARIPAPSSAR
jgi:histidinol phosphatase-like PHP family hydrolase